MILVDKKIKERHTEIFSDNCYDEKYVNAVSYLSLIHILFMHFYVCYLWDYR